MVDPRRIARIREAGGQPLSDPEIALDLAQNENPCIRGQPAAIEGGGDFFAGDGWQTEGKTAILLAAGVSLLLVRVSSDGTTGIIREINRLCYIRRTKIGPVVNNPG